MKDLWAKVCNHYDVPEDIANSWYERIKQRLSAPIPSRTYHNWHEMMQHKRENLMRCKPSIILAAFFQYYEYDCNRSCVKENCAAFEEFSREAIFDDEDERSLILRLLGDKPNDGELTMCYENEANLLQDVDLVILAAPADDYKHYTQLLRREYAHLNEDNYKLMRLKVLETLLMIPNIFSTTEFQTKYEQAARLNIKKEIEELKQ